MKHGTSYSSGTKFHLITQSAVNIEPAMYSGHLSYPWGQHWREGGEGGDLEARGGGQ